MARQALTAGTSRVAGRPSSAARLRQHHRQQIGQEDSQSWMMVYLDVLTLLLVLFVLLMMRMSPDMAEQEAEVAPPVAAVIGKVQPEQPLALPEQTETISLTADEQLADRLKQDLARHDFQGVAVTADKGLVKVTLPDKVLFGVGRADLIQGADGILGRIVPVLAESDYRISVEGHTDDRPIATRRFPSNWELSAARAARVIRFLQAQGIAMQRMQAVGYADTRPLSDNGSEAGRSRNRRVNLVIHLAQQ